MTFKVRPKRSNVPSKVPLSSDLDIGELAINMADQKIYTKAPDNSIVELGGATGTIDLSAVDQDIIPDGDLTRSLGSPTHQWADLYVGNATIYLNNVPLGLDGDQNLTFNGNVIADSNGNVNASTGDWAFIGGIAYNATSFDQGLAVSPGGEGISYVYVPGNSESDSSALQLSNGATTGQVQINAYNKQWQFDANGNLKLPAGGDIVDSTGASVLGGGTSYDQSLNTTDDVTFNNVALTGNITSGGMEIYTNSGSGGSIDLYTDWTGTGTTGGLDLWLLHGDGIYLKTDDGAHEWKFDNTGKLILPAGGDIVNSTGTSVLGGGSFSGSYNDLTDKPTIPADISDLTDSGNLLGSGSSLVPTGTTGPASPTQGQLWYDTTDGRTYIYFDSSWVDAAPAGGGIILPADASGYLVNDGAGNLSWAAGDGTFSGDYNDLVNKPTIPADVADLTDNSNLLGGGSGNPFNQSLNNNDSVQFANVQVNGTGKLTQGWNTVTRASGYERVPAGQTVDIWTADNAEVTGAKFTVVFENRTAEPYYNNFDTLTCEIAMAKKRTGGTWADPVISVYGIVHTSNAPTVTFSAVTDVSGRAVLRCTPVGSITSDCYVKVHSVEQQSPSIQNDWC